nr:integrase, catalytic region, zinc finger, CCHC-type, peptidase aspartic, catalytic [Tanacetum cinerariifolium]
MIMLSKDSLYNGRKGIGFENPSYFEKAKDLRPSLYDEKVIGLGYTMMFLIQSDEALEIKKFKRARENKIEFAYDYGNLNVSYVNEKINFSDDYFQEIINPDFEMIDSEIKKFKRARENKIEFAYDYGNLNQISLLKPYVPNVNLKKIIIDLEDEVVSLLEKEKANLKTIESLKSKGFESSRNVISKSKNQSENDCHVVEKECDKVENSKKGSSNTSNVDLSSVSHSKLNKDVKRYSRKDLSYNNSHLGETSSAYVFNDAMNVSCNSRMCDSFDENNLFIFDDESVRISPVSKMPFRKKPRDSMNIVQICLWIIDSGCSKHMTCNRALLTNFVEKFLETVRFGNNNFAVITGYGDVVIGSITIKKVYYVEGLGHNLFSVGQFYDKGLEVAFQKSTCFVRNEDGVDLLTGDRSSNLYIIALNEVASNSSTCLLAKASSSQSWLWHQRLSHLNFSTINNLVKNNLVQDEASEVIISFIKKSQVNLQLQVQRVRTDNGTEFKNKILAKFFDEIMKSSTTNVETSINEEVFHEVSESFQGESSSSSLNDDVQQSIEEVILPQTNTQSISNNMVPNVDEASKSHNVFNERLEDAYFDASTSFHDPFNVHTFYQPYPHEKKWTKDYLLHKIIAEAFKDADWVSAMQDELDQFARLKV